jgi:hypothetical protein
MLLKNIYNNILRNNINEEDVESESDTSCVCKRVKKEEIKNLQPISKTPIIIYFTFGIFAAYLSWTSNKKIGRGIASRVIFAIFSFFFPFVYFYIHVVYKSDILTYMERTKTEFVEIVPPHSFQYHPNFPPPNFPPPNFPPPNFPPPNFPQPSFPPSNFKPLRIIKK